MDSLVRPPLRALFLVTLWHPVVRGLRRNIKVKVFLGTHFPSDPLELFCPFLFLNVCLPPQADAKGSRRRISRPHQVVLSLSGFQPLLDRLNPHFKERPRSVDPSRHHWLDGKIGHSSQLSHPFPLPRQPSLLVPFFLTPNR